MCVRLSASDTLIRPRDGPGEGGKPVVIPKDNQEKMKDMFKINQFNLMASEMIALNRSLPDVRLEGWAAFLQLISRPSLSLAPNPMFPQPLSRWEGDGLQVLKVFFSTFAILFIAILQ